jgi:hypothetical protein
MPVVEYAISQRLRSEIPDYWDHASMLEIACLKDDEEIAINQLGECLAKEPQIWQRQTTARNLGLLLSARAERGQNVDLLKQVIQNLE